MKKNIIIYSSFIFLSIIFKSIETDAVILHPDTTLGPPNERLINAFTQIKDAPKHCNDLIDRWQGIRKFFKEKGFEFGFKYTADFLSNVSSHKYFFLDNFLLSMNIDADKAIQVKNTSFYISILGVSGGKPNKSINSIQGVDNVEAYSTWKIYELQIRRKFFNSKLSMLFGLYDFNSEFDSRQNSAYFINPSQGIAIDISQSGVNGPSIYPTPGAAFKLAYNPIKTLTVETAVFDAVAGDPNNPAGTHIRINRSDGYLITTEIDLDLNKSTGNKISNIKLGNWYYTKTSIDTFRVTKAASASSGHNYGFYLSTEGSLSSASDSSSDKKGLSYFFRTGFANPDLNKINYYIGTGCFYRNLFIKNDMIGIALALAITTVNYREYLVHTGSEFKPNETNIELIYRIAPFPWLLIHPDFQFIFNPLLDKMKVTRVTAGLRFKVSL